MSSSAAPANAGTLSCRRQSVNPGLQDAWTGCTNQAPSLCRSSAAPCSDGFEHAANVMEWLCHALSTFLIVATAHGHTCPAAAWRCLNRCSPSTITHHDTPFRTGAHGWHINALIAARMAFSAVIVHSSTMLFGLNSPASVICRAIH